jgi:hypothetical protein
MGYFVKGAGGSWSKVSKFFVKGSDNSWHPVTKAFVKGNSGWRAFWPKAGGAGPVADPLPTISAGSWTTVSGIQRLVLTGVNGTWTYSGGGTISQTYIFQVSTDGVEWTDIGSAASISNGQTKTLTIYQADFSTNTQYYRLSVTATANVNGEFTTENSNGVTVSIGAPSDLTGLTITPVTSGTGQRSPDVGAHSSSANAGAFTLSWSSLTNVSSIIISWLLEADGNTLNYTTSPTSPQTYTSASSVTASIDYSSTVYVTGHASVYGYAGTGGSFLVQWDYSTNANQYKVAYSINGGTVQNTTTTGNSISLGSVNTGDTISVTVTPHNTTSGSSGGSDTKTSTMPSQTVPSYSFDFDTVGVTPVSYLRPYTTGSTPSITNSGGTLTANAGSWGNSPTQYKYIWELTRGGARVSGVTHTTSSTTDTWAPSYVAGDIATCNVTAYNSYGWSATSYNLSYEYAPPSVPILNAVLSGNGKSGTQITLTATESVGNSVTSYDLQIWAGTTMGTYTVLKTSSVSSSNTLSYTVTVNDATPPPYIFIGYATGTNGNGSGGQYSSNTITSSLTATPPTFQSTPPTFMAPYFPYFVPPTFTSNPNPCPGTITNPTSATCAELGLTRLGGSNIYTDVPSGWSCCGAAVGPFFPFFPPYFPYFVPPYFPYFVPPTFMAPYFPYFVPPDFTVTPPYFVPPYFTDPRK